MIRVVPAGTEAAMLRWILFFVITVLMMVAAPRAAGAGVEVTGLGGVQFLGGSVSGVISAGTLRLHFPSRAAASYGVDLGYSWMGQETRTHIAAVIPGYVFTEENDLAWVAASVKGRSAPVGDAHPYLVLSTGVADHMTRGPGDLPLETVHHVRFLMSIGAGVESERHLGPVFEFRAMATGLDRGAAFGLGAAVGIRLSP